MHNQVASSSLRSAAAQLKVVDDNTTEEICQLLEPEAIAVACLSFPALHSEHLNRNSQVFISVRPAGINRDNTCLA